MEVFELASTIGIHGYLVALPTVLEELERRVKEGKWHSRA